MRRWNLLLFGCAALAMTTAAQGQVTLLGNYRLGEDDAGAVVGGAGNATTTDIAGAADNLNKVGTPTYAANSVAGIGSLSMNFNGSGDSYSRPVFSPVTDNFVMQGWVTRDVGSNNAAAFSNGVAGGDGVSMFFHDNGHGGLQTWHGLYGNVAFNDTLVPSVAGLPTHLAVVRNSGTTTVYVNGVAKLVNTTGPITPTTNFTIGGFDGRADQVSLGTFTAGTFNPATDLSFPFSTSSALTPLYTNGFETGDAAKYTLSGNVGVTLASGYPGLGSTTQGVQMAAFNGGETSHNGVVTSSVIQGMAGMATYAYFDWGNYGASVPQNLLIEVLDANTNAVLYSQTIDDGLGTTSTALFSPWFLSFVPTVGNFRLRFTDFGGSAAGGSDGLLDNIRVAQLQVVPEPSGIALWSIGGLLIVGLAWFRKMRR